MITTTIGKYTYKAKLLNLFEHHDYGQKYLAAMMRCMSAESFKLFNEADDNGKKAILTASVMMATSENQRELSALKMIALVGGECVAVNKEGNEKPVHKDTVFSNHFRNSSNPKEMTQLLDFLAWENAKDFLPESPSASQSSEDQEG